MKSVGRMLFGTWILYRPDAIQVWKNQDVIRRLSWYYKVMKDIKPAKFIIAKRVEVHDDPKKLDYECLWSLHDKVAKDFRKIFSDIKNDYLTLSELEKPKISFLDVKIELTKRILKKCIFCERKCMVDRASGHLGSVCKLDYRTYVHSWFHHLGEESPLVPSGTIFYGSCNFRCVYCIDEDEYILVRTNGVILVKKVKEVAKDIANNKKVEVLTLSGWRKVYAIVNRISNEIYEVITNGGKRVKLTPEHIVVIQYNGKLKEVYVKDLRVGDKLVTLPCNLFTNERILNNNVKTINIIEEFNNKLPLELKRKIRIRNISTVLRRIRRIYGISYRELFAKANIKNYKYYWLYADSMPFLSFIKLYRKYREIRENIALYSICMKRCVKHHIPALIKLTPQFMRLLGYFVAKGNYLGERGLIFTVPNKTMQSDLICCIKSVIPCLTNNEAKLTYRYREKALQVIVLSKLLYLLFKYVLGIENEAGNKKFPWIVFNVNKGLLKEFLSAYFTGDRALKIRRKRTFFIRFVTNSENVAYGLAYLLGLNNIQYRIKEKHPSIKHALPIGHKNKRKQFWIEVNGVENLLKLFNTVMFMDENKRGDIIQRISSDRKMEKIRKGDYVKELKIIKTRRRVYDIIIDSQSNRMEEHVFFAGNGILIHNCQNFDISQTEIYGGVEVSAKKLAIIQKELRVNGARNINHVGGEPTPNLHTIVESLKYLDINVPQLWNSNMYLTVESMKILVDIIDIWLPDFKYGNNECAMRLSSAPKYFESVTRNLKIAIKHGDMIIRHLVLPNHLECCTKPILKWIAKNLPKDKVLVNIMAQYRPEYLVAKYPSKWSEIARRPTHKEMVEAYSLAKSLGIAFEPVS